MPRRAKRAPVPPMLPNDTVELADLGEAVVMLSPTEERREREVEEVVSELGSDGRIKVWSVIDGKATYSGDMSASEFTLDALLDAYGGGDKSLVLMQGKTKVDTFKVSLDPTIPVKNPRAMKAAAVANGGPNMDMANMMALMMKSSLDNAQAVNTMMSGMMGALTSVMTATRPQTDPMDAALRIAEVMKGGGNNTSDALAMFREGLELAREMGGGKDDDGTTGLISKGMDTLSVLVKGIVEAQKNKPVAVIPAPPPETTLSPEGNGVAPQTPISVRPWVDAAAPNIGALLNASRFMPPHAAAATIDSLLSDEQFEDLITDIVDEANGGFGVRLRAYFPNDITGETAQAEWLGQVVHILLEEYNATDDDEPETANGKP